VPSRLAFQSSAEMGLQPQVQDQHMLRFLLGNYNKEAKQLHDNGTISTISPRRL